jgi:transposase
VVAAWFRRRGARVVLVPTTQSADLRAYYAKHTKNDRLDSAILARLPLLHPEGLREYTTEGPADPLRRIVKQRSSLGKRRAAIRHHDSAVCHIATILLTRIATCWRLGEPYQIRDLDGTPLTMAEGKRVVAQHHQVPKKRTASYHRATNHKADREQHKSLSAPTSRPAQHKPKPPRAA